MKARHLLVAALVAGVPPAAALGQDAAVEDLLDGPRVVQLEYEMGSRSLEMYTERTRRLKRVSDRIRLHGAELCGEDLAPIWGMVVTSQREMPASFYYPALERWRLDDRVRVIWTLPGFAAEESGILEGDVVTRINGKPLDDARALREYRPAYGELGPPVLRLLRDDLPLHVVVENQPGCFSPADIAFGDSINAYADGKQMIVYSGLIREFPDDDALAAVVGHELAHNVLGHRGSDVQEAEADYLGTYFAARAGYDVSAGLEVERRLAEQTIYSVARAHRLHPSAPARILALQKAIAEINAKQAAGLPLEPEGLR